MRKRGRERREIEKEEEREERERREIEKEGERGMRKIEKERSSYYKVRDERRSGE